jgi:hypothetical protein
VQSHESTDRPFEAVLVHVLWAVNHVDERVGQRCRVGGIDCDHDAL